MKIDNIQLGQSIIEFLISLVKGPNIKIQEILIFETSFLEILEDLLSTGVCDKSDEKDELRKINKRDIELSGLTS